MNLIGSLLFVLASAEPDGLAKLVRAADKAVVEQALNSVGLVERCQGALQKNDVNGLHCRLVVVEAIAVRPIESAADVDVRIGLANDALIAADHIARTAPTAPEPGLRRTRFEAHKRACGIAFSALGDLEALPAAHVGSPRAKIVVAGVSTTKALPAVGLRDGACACAQRTVDLAVGAEASADEQAGVEGVLTRNRCFLSGDGLKIAARKDPSKAFQTGDSALRLVAEASSPAGRLVEMAKGRSIEFSRCTDRHVTDGKVKDKAKLSSCACGIVSRWSLPLKKDDPKVQARLPILDGDKLLLPVIVEANAVTGCGDVEGTLLAP
ncbi:MAG: hypothetical protein Q8O67_01575 [Deltaproteobacteria bacterium]|nr:hypothetical protein [Deltaproteobacteria bacterium]